MAKLNFGGVEENVVTREEFPLAKAQQVLKDEVVAVANTVTTASKFDLLTAKDWKIISVKGDDGKETGLSPLEVNTFVRYEKDFTIKKKTLFSTEFKKVGTWKFTNSEKTITETDEDGVMEDFEIIELTANKLTVKTTDSIFRNETYYLTK